MQEKADRFDCRSYSPPSRSVEFLATKLLASWRSLTSLYPRNSHSIVPSNFGGSLEPSWLRGNSDQPKYVRRNESLVPLLKKDCPSPSSSHNAPGSDTTRGPNENLPTKQRALPSQKRTGALMTCTTAKIKHQSLP